VSPAGTLISGRVTKIEPIGITAFLLMDRRSDRVTHDNKRWTYSRVGGVCDLRANDYLNILIAIEQHMETIIVLFLSRTRHVQCVYHDTASVPGEAHPPGVTHCDCTGRVCRVGSASTWFQCVSLRRCTVQLSYTEY